jgi:hypothetical protein
MANRTSKIYVRGGYLRAGLHPIGRLKNVYGRYLIVEDNGKCGAPEPRASEPPPGPLFALREGGGKRRGEAAGKPVDAFCWPRLDCEIERARPVGARGDREWATLMIGSSDCSRI